ncbi:dickkopf-related protein 4-like [Paroedura picta]|uniref:dickkopf-related protein 4-like n=1 Tax=Paroedura picta TaxID=143630 RepID=UPI0040563EA7
MQHFLHGIDAFVKETQQVKQPSVPRAPKNQAQSAQCLIDKDCHAGKFCHKTWEELPHSATCHGLRRRCQRNAMCCPGSVCINDVCSQIERVMQVNGKQHIEQADSGPKGTPHPVQEGNIQKKGNPRTLDDAGKLKRIIILR